MYLTIGSQLAGDTEIAGARQLGSGIKGDTKESLELRAHTSRRC